MIKKIILCFIMVSLCFSSKTKLNFLNPTETTWCHSVPVLIEVEAKKQMSLFDEFDETDHFPNGGEYQNVRINPDGSERIHWGQDISYRPHSTMNIYAPYDLILRHKYSNVPGYGIFAAAYAPEIGKTLIFAHLDSEPSHTVNSIIRRGTLFAVGGGTGWGNPHLHIEVLDGDCGYGNPWGSVRNIQWRHERNEDPRPYIYESAYSFCDDTIFVHVNGSHPSYIPVIRQRRVGDHDFYNSSSETHNPFIYSFREVLSYEGTYDICAEYHESYINITETEPVSDTGEDISIDTLRDIFSESRQVEIEDCGDYIVIIQKGGFIRTPYEADDRFDPNEDACDVGYYPNGLYAYESIQDYRTASFSTIVATGVVYFTPGNTLELTHTVAGSTPSLSWSVVEPGKATWKFSARCDEIDDSRSVKIRARDLVTSAGDEIGLWFIGQQSCGMQKTNLGSSPTSITFRCPYCPQKPEWENDSWTISDSQQNCDMVMKVHSSIRFKYDIYNTKRSFFEVIQISDFDVDDPSTLSRGYSTDIVGEASYHWTKNGGYSDQSNFDLYDGDPSSIFFRRFHCCDDCECTRYIGKAQKRICSNMNLENFIFPEWELEATDPSMKNTFGDIDKLMPSRALITRTLHAPEKIENQTKLINLWRDNLDMVIAADSADQYHPTVNRSGYDYHLEKPSNPILDEDTLVTIAIPDDYQIPIIAKPNPFNTEVSITFELEQEENCKVSIFDMEGSLREVIFDGIVSSRSKTLSWQCSSCPSGTYFVVVTTPSTYSTKKINLVK